MADYWLLFIGILHIHIMSTSVIASVTDDVSTEHHIIMSQKSVGPQCPENCTCHSDVTASKRSINCGGNESLHIEESINAYLDSTVSQNWTSVNLYIIDTLVENLIEITCIPSMEELYTLTFENNTKITNIPNGFINKLSKLREFNMRNSSIKRVSADLFRDSKRLQSIDFSDNKINHIDPEAFIGLSVLGNVILLRNNLTELDIWPVYLAVTVMDRTINIDVTDNQIERFTNNLKWNYTCAQNPAHAFINIGNNKLKHIISLVHGSGLSELSIICLFRSDDFRMNLEDNPLICDCVDFEIYKYMFLTKKTTTINNLMCEDPPKWKDTKLISHHLIELTCDLHDNCPEHCTCVQRPANMTVHILCEGRVLTDLPVRVPIFRNLTRYKYLLEYSGNRLTSLDYRQYYNVTNTCSFGDNIIEYLNATALRTLLNHTEKLYLHNNKLEYLPTEMQQLNFSSVRELSLYGNPWSCDCSAQWLLAFLTSVKDQLVFPGGILCSSPSWLAGHSILSLTADDFCSDPERKKLTEIIVASTIAVIATLILLIVPYSVTYYKRVWLYKTFKLHPFDWDECTGENKEFDAFVSYATEDEAWVLQLVTELEALGYKLLFHRRDFDGGKPITVNVEEAVDKSKRTICVVSQAFTRSSTCKWEFDTALNIALQMKKSRLIIIKHEDIDLEVMGTVPRSISLHMSKYTYIDKLSPYFMENLTYSLPVQMLGQLDPGASGSNSTNEQADATGSSDRDALVT